MISGVSKIELTNSDDELLTFNKISSEGEVYTQTPLSMEVGSGGSVYAGSEYQIKFTSYDVDNYNDLVEWMGNEKTCTAVVYGNETNVVWKELTPLKVERLIETLSGKLLAFTVTINIKGEYSNIMSVSSYSWIDGNGNYFVETTETQILLYKR